MAKLTKEQFDQMDFEALKIIIRAKLDFKLLIDIEFDGSHVELSSSNLVSLAGILQYGFKSAHLCNFGGTLSNDGKAYCLPLHFRFKGKRDGGTGAEICDLWWHFDSKMWTIKD